MSTRDAFGRALAELGDKYKFVVFCADATESTKTSYFKEKYPERFIECGIAEANMMSMAAGFASTGVPVFVSAYAMFTAGRTYEQIRQTVAFPHLNVKIGATHAGLSAGEDGASHHCLEDIALMRVIPGMIVISPCDGIEAKKAVEASLNVAGPVYLRFGRTATPIISAEDYPFELGKGVVMEEGNDAIVFATGNLVYEALMARKILLNKGIKIAVVNIHTIKPIDEELIIKYASKNNRIFTVEEHSIIGGLGSAVLETLSEKIPVKLTRIGINDIFSTSGNIDALLALYELNATHIAKKITAGLH
jgi:transketolase